MKTKQIPALISLSAGFIACLAGIFQHIDFLQFVKTLLLVLIIFYILGCVIAFILNKNFNHKKDNGESAEEAVEEESEADVENIEAEEEKK